EAVAGHHLQVLHRHRGQGFQLQIIGRYVELGKGARPPDGGRQGPHKGEVVDAAPDLHHLARADAQARPHDLVGDGPEIHGRVVPRRARPLLGLIHWRFLLESCSAYSLRAAHSLPVSRPAAAGNLRLPAPAVRPTGGEPGARSPLHRQQLQLLGRRQPVQRRSYPRHQRRRPGPHQQARRGNRGDRPHAGPRVQGNLLLHVPAAPGSRVDANAQLNAIPGENPRLGASAAGCPAVRPWTYPLARPLAPSIPHCPLDLLHFVRYNVRATRYSGPSENQGARIGPRADAFLVSRQEAQGWPRKRAGQSRRKTAVSGATAGASCRNSSSLTATPAKAPAPTSPSATRWWCSPGSIPSIPKRKPGKLWRWTATTSRCGSARASCLPRSAPASTGPWKPAPRTCGTAWPGPSSRWSLKSGARSWKRSFAGCCRIGASSPAGASTRCWAPAKT